MNCIFCSIVKGEIPAKIIAENDNALAFLDVNPIADGHTIIIPKQHYRSWSETPNHILADVCTLAKDVASTISKSKLKPWGFNYLSNEGSIAGQEVFHFHLHVIPKYGKDEGLSFTIKNKYVDNIEEIYQIILKKIRK